MDDHEEDSWFSSHTDIHELPLLQECSLQLNNIGLWMLFLTAPRLRSVHLFGSCRSEIYDNPSQVTDDPQAVDFCQITSLELGRDVAWQDVLDLFPCVESLTLCLAQLHDDENGEYILPRSCHSLILILVVDKVVSEMLLYKSLSLPRAPQLRSLALVDRPEIPLRLFLLRTPQSFIQRSDCKLTRFAVHNISIMRDPLWHVLELLSPTLTHVSISKVRPRWSKNIDLLVIFFSGMLGEGTLPNLQSLVLNDQEVDVPLLRAKEAKLSHTKRRARNPEVGGSIQQNA